VGLVFADLSHDRRQIHHLPPLQTRSGNPLEAGLTVSTPLWTQDDDFVRGFDKTKRSALMACLSSCFLATGLAQTPSPLLGIPIGGRGFTTVVAIFGQTPFQLMHLLAELFHLLAELLIFCDDLSLFG
jgi:hypothetical protein